MTTLEIDTKDILAINKLQKLAKDKFNFNVNIIKEKSLDEKYYPWFEEDRERLQKRYKLIKAWKTKLYSQEEFKEEMDLFMGNLTKKYENN